MIAMREPLPAQPRASLANFSACKPELVVLARLIGAPGELLPRPALRQDLDGLLTTGELSSTLDVLAERRDIKRDRSIQLTRQGSHKVRAALGSDRIENWSRTRATRLPLLTLGLDPSNPAVRRRFARAECLKAATISVAYALSPHSISSTRAVCSDLVWRLVGVLFPHITGNAPHPKLEKFGPVERALLCGLANAKHETLFDIVNEIASAAVGLESASITELRERLIRIGVERATGIT